MPSSTSARVVPLRALPLPAWAQGLRLRRLADLEESGEAGAHSLPTGLEALDQSLGGGVPLGLVTELSGPLGSLGLTGLQHTLLASARERQHFTAFVDAFDRFDPGGCAAPLCEALLWVRGTGQVTQALRATDLLVRDPNFGLLVLDLREATARELRRVPLQHWYRLQRALRENGGTLVAFTPWPCIPSAGTRVQFATGTPPRWTLLRHPGQATPPVHAAAG